MAERDSRSGKGALPEIIVYGSKLASHLFDAGEIAAFGPGWAVDA